MWVLNYPCHVSQDLSDQNDLMNDLGFNSNEEFLPSTAALLTFMNIPSNSWLMARTTYENPHTNPVR